MRATLRTKFWKSQFVTESGNRRYDFDLGLIYSDPTLIMLTSYCHINKTSQCILQLEIIYSEVSGLDFWELTSSTLEKNVSRRLCRVVAFCCNLPPPYSSISRCTTRVGLAGGGTVRWRSPKFLRNSNIFAPTLNALTKI